MNKSFLVFLVSSQIIFTPILSAAKDQSVYTDLKKTCKELDKQNESYSRLNCGAVGDYTLLLERDDDRNSVTLKKEKTEMPLNLFHSVSGGVFNEIVGKAEWLVKRNRIKISPYALIIRMVWSGSDDNVNKKGNALVIIRIRESSACLVGIVDTIKDKRANESARKIAQDMSVRCI